MLETQQVTDVRFLYAYPPIPEHKANMQSDLPGAGLKPTKARALLVSHRGERCGVWQFGMRLHHALSGAESGLDWQYAECANLDEFHQAADASRPDVVLVNAHPSTLPWAMDGVTHGDALTAAVFHEASQTSVAALRTWPFDVLLCPDPTFLSRDPRAVPVPRFIPRSLLDVPPPPEIFTIGSFGFGTPGKGFDRLCALVNDQFETARIRINIPPHDNPEMVSAESLQAIIESCRAAVTKSGIDLEISHRFFDDAGLLHFLAENTLNAFFYDDEPGRGISSCTDYALSAGRPIAVSRTAMFRHLIGANPSICLEDRPLLEIARSGTEHLELYRQAYAEAAAGAAWNEALLGALASRGTARAVPDRRGYNKLLDDSARGAYIEALNDLAVLAPDILSRKIPRANIQQAFALDAARRLALKFPAPRILAIGSYEDTAVASLKALGYRVDEIDPQVNGTDLEGFYRAKGAGIAYDIVLCVSVLEHVADDENFVRQAAALLSPSGYAIFTVDFSNRYPETGQRPAADHRLYTSRDLTDRLMAVLPGCCLIDRPHWDEGAEDFEYEGCRYAFATWTFTRLWQEASTQIRAAEEVLGGPPWKELLQRSEATQNQALAGLRAQHAEVAAGYEKVISGHEVAASALQAELAVARSEVAEWSQKTAKALAELHDLRVNLHLPNPPIALRLTLPLARALRRLRRTIRPDEPQHVLKDDPAVSSELGLASDTPPTSQIVPAKSRSWSRRILRATYAATLRPVARPVLWRIRGFMTGPVIEELRAQEHRNASRAAAIPVPNPTSVSAGATDLRLAQAMEAALLTLALEGQSRPQEEAPAREPERA